jgi:hypothetical protein
MLFGETRSNHAPKRTCAVTTNLYDSSVRQSLVKI